MGLKIQRETNLDELFNKFAIDPDKKTVVLPPDPEKEKAKKAKQTAEQTEKK